MSPCIFDAIALTRVALTGGTNNVSIGSDPAPAPLSRSITVEFPFVSHVHPLLVLAFVDNSQPSIPCAKSEGVLTQMRSLTLFERDTLPELPRFLSKGIDRCWPCRYPPRKGRYFSRLAHLKQGCSECPNVERFIVPGGFIGPMNFSK